MPQLVSYLLGSRVFRDQSTFQGNWLLEAFSPTVPSSSTSTTQMEPYLPVKSTDEGMMELNLRRLKDVQSVSNAVEKKEMEIW